MKSERKSARYRKKEMLANNVRMACQEVTFTAVHLPTATTPESPSFVHIALLSCFIFPDEIFFLITL
ncbi:hypothetical protein KIN20_027429 [Parelaphostrongylus tenuis]|uniref:Uncharacterized protein n=1 Tax=Parelaphostrongylus tenuis TaxID=148309 RepID=A0AAD5QZJ5_PARTN|nr:hypothetical protein KIN20_027429 [Parelaphostrongylus tenuis]